MRKRRGPRSPPTRMEEQQGPRVCVRVHVRVHVCVCVCVRVMKGFAYSSSDPPRICRLAPGSRCFPATRCKRVVSASATTATCRTIFSRERCKRAFQLFSPQTAPPRAFRTTAAAATNTITVILNKRGRDEEI